MRRPKGFGFGLLHFKHLIINARAAPPRLTGSSRQRVEVADGEAEAEAAAEEKGAIFYPLSERLLSIALSCSQVVVQGVDVVLKN